MVNSYNLSIERLYKAIQTDYINKRSQQYENENPDGRRGIGYFFAEWYFTKLHDMPLEEVEKIITDGFHDQGIDAINYVANKKEVEMYQFKMGNIRVSDVSMFCDGFQRFREILKESGNGRDSNLNEKLLERADFLRGLILNGEIKSYNLILVTNKEIIGQEASNKLHEFVEQRRLENITISYEIIKGDDLFQIFMKNIHDVKLGSVLVKIESELKNLPIINGIRTFVAIISGEELGKLYSTYGEKLLEKNVRVYKEASLINKKIYETAISNESPNPFLYYNNGITIVANDLNNPGVTITLENPQVVNGGQTLRAIHKAYKERRLSEEVYVHVRIIIIGENPQLASEISVKLNTQTNIESQDVISSIEIILLLDELIRLRGYYLERRKDEFNFISEEKKQELANHLDVSIEELETRVIPLKDLIQYLVIMVDDLESIIQVKREYSQFMKGNIISEILTKIIETKPDQIIKIYYFGKIITDLVSENKRRISATISWYNLFEKLQKKYTNIKVRNIISNSNLFVHGLLYNYYVKHKEMSLEDVIALLEEKSQFLFMEAIEMIIHFVINNPKKKNATWRTLLIRPSFYANVVEWVKMNWDNYEDKVIKIGSDNK